MVLPGVSLREYAAHAGLVPTDQDEKVFDDEPPRREVADQFDMSEPLLARTHFILALEDEHAALSEDPPGFIPCPEVEVKDGFVIFLARPVPCLVVSVILLIVLV
jgi:hypothetical protein